MFPSAVDRIPSVMTHVADPNSRSVRAAVRRQLPATGLPTKREDRRGWGLLSALLHALLIALLIAPLASHNGIVIEHPQGAGGPGPAGGGGGGKRGTGGVHEKVNYVQVPPPAPAAKPAAVVPPPVVQPKPQPVIPPPAVIKPPEPIPEAKVEAKVEAPKVEATAPIPGTGGGTGRDGTTGTGPGTGGGTGSGVGTGRGSGIGPGTGGGTQKDFSPSPTELFIPPLPMPDKVRGFHLVVEFDVDSTGKVVHYDYTHTRDGGYNRRLEDIFNSTKFRPGTRPDGTPIRMKAQIIYDF